ncbi:unnamed protein product [Closterium sp. Naga37s-1]|nr:unnamed protein product [Closterium sp. Naga37s-1]
MCHRFFTGKMMKHELVNLLATGASATAWNAPLLTIPSVFILFPIPPSLLLTQPPPHNNRSISEGMECPSPASACTPSLTSLLASSSAPLAFCSLCPNFCTQCKTGNENTTPSAPLPLHPSLCTPPSVPLPLHPSLRTTRFA